MLGNAVEHIPNITNEDSCAVQVSNRYPEATGATWYTGKHPGSCYAEFGGRLMNYKSSLSRACRFQGILLGLFTAESNLI